MFLQNCKDLVRSEHNSGSDGCVVSCDDDDVGGDDDEKKIMDIEVEEETDVETQQAASDMTFLAENFKHEVSLPCVHYKRFFMKMLGDIDHQSFPSLSVSHPREKIVLWRMKFGPSFHNISGHCL